jgi:hypothetical protein
MIESKQSDRGKVARPSSAAIGRQDRPASARLRLSEELARDVVAERFGHKACYVFSGHVPLIHFAAGS